MAWVSFQTRIDQQDVREVFAGNFYAWVYGEVEGVVRDRSSYGTYSVCNEIRASAEGVSPDMAMQQAMSDFQFKVQEAKYRIEQSLMDRLS